jgi:hypothetical protein
LLKATMVVALILIVAYVVAERAMTGKPISRGASLIRIAAVGRPDRDLIGPHAKTIRRQCARSSLAAL